MNCRTIVVEKLLNQLENPEIVLDFADDEFLQIAQDVHLAIMGLEEQQLNAEQEKVFEFLKKCDEIFREELVDRGYALVDTKYLIKEDPESIREKLGSASMDDLLGLSEFLSHKVAEEPRYADVISLIDREIICRTTGHQLS